MNKVVEYIIGAKDATGNAVRSALARLKSFASSVGSNLQNIRAGIGMFRTAMSNVMSVMQKTFAFEKMTVQFKTLIGSMDEAREALRAVQSLEPPGIGARSVEECLKLQLEARERVDPLCYDLVQVHLMDIARGNYRQIAKETGASVSHVRECVDMIRSLNPAPVSLSEGTVQYIMPEFSVEADGDGTLSILFHNDYYPTIRQDENFRRLSRTLSGEEQEYARKMLRSSSRLIRAAELRQRTVEKVAQIIVREQRPFFLGQYSLMPLRISDAAEEIGVHETTVYRAIQNKYLYCARGTFSLHHFFQRELSGGASTARVKEIIREICLSDGKLSDQKIADELSRRGITMARRTVAKYRLQMNIASGFERDSGGNLPSIDE